MVRNRSVKFVSRHVHVRVEQTDTPFTMACDAGQVLSLPIAHGEGNYFADPAAIAALEQHRQVIFRYTSRDGVVSDAANPNGSLNNIAGYLQRRAERGGTDAASRARVRSGARQR